MSFNLPIAADKATHIVVYHQDPPSNDSNLIADLRREVFNLSKELNALTKRVLHMEIREEDANEKRQPYNSPFFAPAVAPEPSGLEVRRLSEEIPPPVDTSNAKEVFASLVNKEVPADIPEPDIEEEMEAEEEQEAEVEEEEDEEQEEEAEGVAMEEFEYKGVTYYRDGENQVYQLDEDGDLDDTPIGVWNEVKQKVIKYAKA